MDIVDIAKAQRIGGADGELVEALCGEIESLRSLNVRILRIIANEESRIGPLCYGVCKDLKEARDSADSARREGLFGMYPAACVVLDMQIARLTHKMSEMKMALTSNAELNRLAQRGRAKRSGAHLSAVLVTGDKAMEEQVRTRIVEADDNQHAVCLDEKSQFNGWVLYRHPDGQWVSLRPAMPIEIAAASFRLSNMEADEGLPQAG